MEFFEIVRVAVGHSHAYDWRGPKEKLFLVKGACIVKFGSSSKALQEGDVLDLPPAEEEYVVTGDDPASTLVRVTGRWGEETGSSGVFTLYASGEPLNQGDPTEYERNTQFDNHYHDCDECWIIIEGRGQVISEGIPYEVSGGDCVATGRVHHHDFPWVQEPVLGIWFETTLEEEKRKGHLWNHTHGVARPLFDRV